MIEGTPSIGEESQTERGVAVEEELKRLREEGEEVPIALKEELVLKHLPLVRFIVYRLKRRLPSHVDIEDLYNTGVLGLLDAIDKYDPRQGTRLKTYAEYRIRGAIFDELRSLDWVPRAVRQKKSRLERARRELEQRLGRSASDEELADSLGLQVERFHALVTEAQGTSLMSLDSLGGRREEGGERSFADFIPDTSAEVTLEGILREEKAEAVITAVGKLPPAEKAVISLYFYSGLSEDDAGEILGVTESRVTQLIDKALLRLEHAPSIVRYAP